MTITPRHSQTRCALAQAVRLADLLCPTNQNQAAARQHIINAAQSGNLYDAVNAVTAARSTGRRGLATIDWRCWADSWLARVNRIILADIEQERAA
ncbi:MAG: hypothetical protein JXB07_18805 [Anaerolineae bacterium]|nr:hypothetical protein [Anaerolineae bacterium]